MTLRPSLFRHLLAWGLGAVLLVCATFVWVGFETGGHEADELTDGHLAGVAALMLTQPLDAVVAQTDAAALGGRSELKAHDYQQSLSIVQWRADGRLLARIGAAPLPPFESSEGFATLSLGAPPTAWRAFSRWDRPARERRITVLLSVAERDELADDIAMQVATPGLWLLPAVALGLTLAMRRGLRPLLDLSDRVGRLEIDGAAGLQGPPHQEFQPVVQSINTLIDRYKAALGRERALASEVAHELRTPLASLSLHAASLRDGACAADRDAALRRIEHDAVRAGNVLTQLLALARASRTEMAEAVQPVELDALARRVAAEYGQAAHASGHELAVDAPQRCVVDGHAVLLEIALRNLIDNALAHTPAGTAVQVRVSAGPPTIEVCDDGRARCPHPADAVPRSTLGLGLGHQVVGRVAAIHDGRFVVVGGAGEGVGDSGITCYRIVLGAPATARPAAAAAATDGSGNGPAR